MPGIPLVGKRLHLDERLGCSTSGGLPWTVFASPKLTLKIRPLVRSWPFTSLWWHWFLSYQSIMKTLPSGPYLRLMICDQRSLASRKSGACEPTKPEPLGVEDVAVDPGPVDVVHEERAAVLGRPGAAQVDHRPGVGVAAAGRVGPAVAAVRVGAQVVAVIGDRLDVVIGVGIEVLARLPLVAAPLDDVIEVRDDAGGDEHLAVRRRSRRPRGCSCRGRRPRRRAASGDSARCRR